MYMMFAWRTLPAFWQKLVLIQLDKWLLWGKQTDLCLAHSCEYDSIVLLIHVYMTAALMQLCLLVCTAMMALQMQVPLLQPQSKLEQHRTESLTASCKFAEITLPVHYRCHRSPGEESPW